MCKIKIYWVAHWQSSCWVVHRRSLGDILAVITFSKPMNHFPNILWFIPPDILRMHTWRHQNLDISWYNKILCTDHKYPPKILRVSIQDINFLLEPQSVMWEIKYWDYYLLYIPWELLSAFKTAALSRY